MADKEYTRDEIIDALKDMYLMIYSVDPEKLKDINIYSSSIMQKAENIIRKYDNNRRD